MIAGQYRDADNDLRISGSDLGKNLDHLASYGAFVLDADIVCCTGFPAGELSRAFRGVWALYLSTRIGRDDIPHTMRSFPHLM